jgi:hypothetical protein
VKQEEALDLIDVDLQNKLQVLRSEAREYYNDSTVLDYLFAAHKSAKSLSPILSGAVFHN